MSVWQCVTEGSISTESLQAVLNSHTDHVCHEARYNPLTSLGFLNKHLHNTVFADMMKGRPWQSTEMPCCQDTCEISRAANVGI